MEYTIDLILRLLDDLDSFKRMIEWNYPMTYQVEIDKVIEIINESISNGYKGIIFNKLKQESNRYKTQSQRNKEFFDKMRKELEDGEKESN